MIVVNYKPKSIKSLQVAIARLNSFLKVNQSTFSRLASRWCSVPKAVCCITCTGLLVKLS